MTLVHRIRRPALSAGLLLGLIGLVGPVLASNIGVSIDGLAFKEAKIVVAEGDTVTWTVTNAMGAPHTVTSGTPTAADKGAVFDSQQDDPGLTKLKDNGGTFAFTFETAGRYDYFCVLHPVDMTGVVVVLASGEAPGEAHDGIPAERRLIGAGILVVTLVVLLGAALAYRRMNPA